MDKSRPAIVLAQRLVQHHFNNVTVVEGGFPAIVEQLMESRGTVEPFVLDHNTEKWLKFLKNTGRDTSHLASAEALRRKQHQDQLASELSSPTQKKPEKIKKAKDLKKEEVYRYALQYTNKLGHKNMQSLLTEKLNELGLNSNKSGENEDQ